MGNIGCVLAERLPQTNAEIVALPVSEHPSEVLSQAQFAVFLGDVALARTVETSQQRSSATLLEAAQRVVLNPEAQDAERYAQAEQQLDLNINLTFSEVLYKKGHMSRVEMTRDKHGDLGQFGQSVYQMHYNSLVFRTEKHETLSQFREIEALNGHRLCNFDRAGTLEDYWYVVPAMVPEGLSEDDLSEYFLHTMSVSDQGTTKQNGKVITETIFSAGIEEEYEDASFEDRMANRRDLASVQAVCIQLGLKPPETVKEALHGYLIHKRLLPNGMIDFKRMRDLAIDQQLGRTVHRPIEEYQRMRVESKTRDKDMAKEKAAVKAELLEMVPMFDHPIDIIQALWELVRQYGTEATLMNTEIDPEVWGAKAAAIIIEARHAAELGNKAAATQLMRQALIWSVAVGCGGSARAASETKGKSTSDDTFKDDFELWEEELAASGGQESYDGDFNIDDICRIEVCVSRSIGDGVTKVGECNVCRDCQKMYDIGIDRSKMWYIVRTPRKKELQNV